MEKVYVAKLGKAVGLQGEMKIYIESDFPGQFKKGATFTTNKNLTLTIASYNEKRGTVKFTDINNVDDAKRLTNSQLFTTYEATRENCELDENQFFWFDIENCEVIEDDKSLGEVVEIHRYPVADYLEIKTSKALVDAGMPKSFLVPYIDEYIERVDVSNKKVYTHDAMSILENS